MSATAAYARDLDEIAGPHERRLDLRTQQRDLGFAHARDRLAGRAYELEDVIAPDERGRVAHELEHHDVGGTEATLERARIGESRTAPDREREVGVDAGARRDLGERPAFAVGSQAADRGEADEPALFLRLHQLRDRRADLVGEIRQQLEARVGAGRPGSYRPAATRSSWSATG